MACARALRELTAAGGLAKFPVAHKLACPERFLADTVSPRLLVRSTMLRCNEITSLRF
jgi:hypothetical protein